VRRSLLGLLAALVGLISAVPALAATSSPPASADWPSYGADLANSRSHAGGPAPLQVLGLHQLWRVDVTGDLTGTPVESGGRVFVGNTAGAASQALAIDAASGRVLWRTPVGGPINSSAAVDSGRVYFAVATVGSPSLIALDAVSGRLLWRTVLTSQPGSDVYASPTVFDGDVIIGTSALFAELNQGGGGVRGSLLRVSGATGRVAWRTFTVAPGHDGGGVWSTAAVDPATGLAYAGTGNAYTAPADAHTDSILQVDFNNGRIVRFFQATPNDVWNTATAPTGSDFDFGASPNLFQLPDGTRVVGEGQKSGVYWVLRRDTLMPLSSTRVSSGGFLGGILGSTAFGGGAVFGPASEPGEIWSVASTGSIRWLEPSPDAVKFGPTALSNGVVYAASSLGFLQAWDAATGAPLAELPLGAGSFGGVSIATGRLFVNAGNTGTSGSVEAFGTG
jgi:polyvinyl alcohol dehydrogenase (cytochrome)